MWCARGAASADDERSETASDVEKRQIIPGGFGARSPAPPPPPLPLSPPNPLNNLQSLILIACLLACFLGGGSKRAETSGWRPEL